MVGAVKRTFSECSLDGQFMLLHAVIFFTAVETWSVSLQGWIATACDEIFEVEFSSYMGLFLGLKYHKIPDDCTCDMTDIRF